MLRSVIVFLFLLTSLAPAQDAASAEKKLRVHVIGASVSGGFRDGPAFGAEEQGDSVTLQRVLGAWAGDHARVTTHSTTKMMAMFTDPLNIGQEQIDAAKKARADLVVAFDFPFWFAYGYVGDDEAKERKQRLQVGLDLLASLDVPVLLGDLPDMTGAQRRMLKPRQIPSPEVLTQLNAQLNAFVAAHPKLHLMPMAKIVHAMRTEGVTLDLTDGPVPTAPGALQQADKLHANRLGMAYLGHLLQTPLAGLFPAGHPLHDQRWTLDQFVAAAGAEGDLELQREAAASQSK